MKVISRTMANQGFGRAPWTKNGQIDDLEIRAFGINFETQERVVLAAISDKTNINLDLEVKDHTGRVITADISKDKRAVLEWVVDAGEEYVVELRAKNSSGQFLLQAFSASPSMPSINLVEIFDADLTGNLSWETVNRRMGRFGYEPIDEPEQLKTARQGLHIFPIKLAKGRCYVFAAQGSPGIDQLGLRLKAHRQLIAADLCGRPEAWVGHCAENDIYARLILRVIAGSGTVMLGGFSSSRRSVYNEVGPPLTPHHAPPTLERARRSVDRALDSQGYYKGEVLFEKEVASGDRSNAVFSLDADECAVLYAANDPGVDDIDIEVFAREKKIAPIHGASNPERFHGICAKVFTTYRMEIISLGGKGKVNAYIRRLPKISIPSLSDPALVFLAQNASARFKLSGMALSDQPIPMKLPGIEDGDRKFTKSISQKERQTTFTASIELTGNRCYGLAVIAPVSIDWVSVRNENGDEVSTWNGPESNFMLASCPFYDQVYKVDIGTAGIEEVLPHILIFGSDVPLGVAGGYP
ncbi:MAG: hypothetical protein GY847_24210 [Proteobacteria bacterium]|nr:hypothetical protein [Pseudomonadota bacterium]